MHKNIALEGQRFFHIDFMRSIAIGIMLFANALPHVSGFHPESLLRIFCSLAAPAFIFLSGYTAGINQQKPVKKALISAAGILTAAVLIDGLVWQVRPFSQFDVLYLISAGLFFNICIRGNGWFQLLAGSLILFGGSSLVSQFSYRFDISAGTNGSSLDFLRNSIQRFLFDGWFPLIPWLGFSFLGYAAWQFREFSRKYAIAGILAGLLLFVFFFLPVAESASHELREGYAEVFYPPSLKVMLLVSGWVCFLYHFLLLLEKRFPAGILPGYFSLPGRHSLLIYNLHSIILGPLALLQLHPSGGGGAMLAFGCLMAAGLLVSFLAELPAFRQFSGKLPLFVRSAAGL